MSVEMRLRNKHYFDGSFGAYAMNLHNDMDSYFSRLQGWERSDVNQTELSFFLGWLVSTQLINTEVSKIDPIFQMELTESLVVRQYQIHVKRNVSSTLTMSEQNELIGKLKNRIEEYKTLFIEGMKTNGSLNGLTLHVFEQIRNRNLTKGYAEHVSIFPNKLVEWMDTLKKALEYNAEMIKTMVTKEVKSTVSAPQSMDQKFIRHTALVAEWLHQKVSQNIKIAIPNDPMPAYCFSFHLCINWYISNYEEKKDEFLKNFKKNCLNIFRNILSPEIDLIDYVDDFLRTYKENSSTIKTYVNKAMDLRTQKKSPSIRRAVPDSTPIEIMMASRWHLYDANVLRSPNVVSLFIEPTIFSLFADYEDLFDYGEVKVSRHN